MPDFERVQALFNDALDLSPDKRDKFVREHCSTDTAKEVFALLSAESGSEAFLTQVFNRAHEVIDDEEYETPEYINHYKIQELIGEGGMGKVFRAWDETLQRTVAIKVLTGAQTGLTKLSSPSSASARQRFFQEAKAAAQINHPNVCDVYEISETPDGTLYIASAFCPGENMAKAIEKNKFTFEQIFQIVLQLCDALNSAHRKGIFHRDIKPANIIVDEQTHIQLIDFGIAKMSNSDLSQTGQLVGTFSHMAPEQFSGGQINQRTDIWAIGVLLYEAITGTRPFFGNNPAETMYQIFHGVFPKFTEETFPYAEQLNQLLKRTINLDRNRCFQNVELLALEIKALLRLLESSKQLESFPNKLSFSPTSKPSDSEANTLSSQIITEYRNVVAMGLSIVKSYATDNDLLGELKRVIKEYKGNIYKQDDSHLYAYFGFPLLREAYADHALACSEALLKLGDAVPEKKDVNTPASIEDNAINIALDHVPVILKSNRQTGRQQIVSNIPWQCQSLLELRPPEPILLTEAINRRLRRPLSIERCWQQNSSNIINIHHQLYCLPRHADETAFVDYKERYTHALTGRVHELGLLEYSWQGVLEGESRTALITGEAGMGKTRLIYEFKQRLKINRTDAIIIECQSDPNRSEVALYPVIYALRLHLKSIKSAYENLTEDDALAQWLNIIDLYSEENYALFAWMMNLSSIKAKQLAETLAAHETPESMRKKCVALMESCIHAISAEIPLLLIFEDLHWADTQTLDWLDSLLSKNLDGSVFILLTGRPELFLRWRSSSSITQLSLNKLGQTESKDLVSSIRLNQQLSDKSRDTILEKSAGNPLYIEEYTKMLLEQEYEDSSTEVTRDEEENLVPETLEDLVNSQLDYLGNSKLIAQAAAVMGRVFNSALLPAILGIDVKNSEQLLSKLLDTRIMYRETDSHLAFRHALIRDALLSAISPQDQKNFHLKIANGYQEKDSTAYEEIAFHLSAAEVYDQSVRCWKLAAKEAQKIHAVLETIRLCQRGLSDIERACETYQIDQVDESSLLIAELELRIMLGPELIASSNYANAEVGQNYQRALLLSEQLEETEHRFAAKMGLWSYCCVRAEHKKALDLAERLVRLAESPKNVDSDDLYDFDNLRVEAYMARGASHLFLANFDQSTKDLDRAIQCYTPSMSTEHIRLYSQEPGMAIYTFKALLEEAKGNAEQAKEASRLSVEAGRRSNHPFSMGFAMAFAVHIAVRQQNVALAMTLREEYKALCEEHDIHVFKLLGALQQGIFQIGAGDLQTGIATIEQAIPAYREFGTGVFVASWYAILAMSYLQLGNAEKAMGYLDKGYAYVEETSENLSLPMLNMIKSQLPACN